MRKVVALIVAIIMVLTLVPALAFAEESVVPTENTPVVEEKEDENQQIYEPEERKEATENLAEDEQEKESLEEDDQSEEELTNEEPLPEETGTENLLGDSLEPSIWDYNEQSEFNAIDANDDPDAKKVTEAVQTNVDALKDLGANPADVSVFSKVMSKVSAVGSLAGGAVSILQMIGIIQDPTSAALNRITSLIQQQNITLNNIEDGIKKIQDQLKDLESKGKIATRSQAAISYNNAWNSFKSRYLEPMKSSMDEYQAMVIDAMFLWTKNTQPEALFAYFTNSDGNIIQTYSQKKNMLLDISDSGDIINQTYTIGLDKSYVAAALKEFREKEVWNKDKFREQLIPYFVKQIKQAITDGKFGCSQSFKDQWNKPGANQDAIAKEAADALLNTSVYFASINVVNNPPNRAVNIYSKIIATLNESKNPNNGIATQINALKMTYNFEGDIKNDILNAYNGMLVLDTLYSSFAMTMCSQSRNVETNKTKEIRNTWADLSEYMKTGKKDAIKGKDNYCYLTNTLVSQRRVFFKGLSGFVTREWNGVLGDYLALDSWFSDKITIKYSDGKDFSGTQLFGEVNANVVNRTFLSFKAKTGQDALYKYFIKNGVVEEKYGSTANLVSWTGPEVFSLNKGVEMVTLEPPFTLNKPKLFKVGQKYRILDSGGDPKLEYVTLHDRVTGKILEHDGNNQPDVWRDTTCIGRAQYTEHHGWWVKDEAWIFKMDGSFDYRSYVNLPDKKHENKRKYTYTVSDHFYTLVCSAAPNLNVEYAEDEFDPNVLVEQMAEEMSGIEVVDTTYKAHTDETIISQAAWKKMDVAYIYDSLSDDELKEYAGQYIDETIAEFVAKGNVFSLSASDREVLINEMVSLIRNAEKGTKSNSNIYDSAYLDPFGIYGNNAITEKLALSVLPDSQIATDGQTMDPVGNMITSAYYEPIVYLSFVKEGSSYTLMPTLVYDIRPYLLVWCEHIQSYDMYPISDDVIQKLGLTMRVRLNASDAGENDIATIVHYDDYENMKVVESKTVTLQGSGKDRYADVFVTSCSPFSISYHSSKATAVKTGDESDIIIWYIVLALSAAIIVAFVIAARRSRKNSK